MVGALILMERCELGQTTESDNKVEKSDVVSVEIREQGSDEAEHEVTELDDQIEKLDDLSDQDSNSKEVEHHAAESNDEIEKSDSVIFQVSEQDLKHQTEESNDEIKKSDAESFEVSEQDLDETEHQMAELDNQIKKLDNMSIGASDQDSNSNEVEHQLGELDDQINKLDVVSVGVSDQDSNSNEVEHHAAESNDEIEKSDSKIFQVSVDYPKHQSDGESVEVSEQDPNEGEDQVAKSDSVKSDAESVEVSEQDPNEGEDQVAKLDAVKSDAESVEVSEQDANEGEDQLAKLDAVDVKVNEEPTAKWHKDYPPLPTSSRKVNNNIVSVKSRKEVPNIKNVEPVAEPEPFSLLMKIPRLYDASIQEQINLAKLQLEEKTRLRDSIQVQIQEKKDNIQTHRLDYESAKDEGNKAKTLVKSKTKQLREGSENELHLNILRKKIQILKESIATTAATATEAEKKLDAENVKIKQLQVKCRAANEARQAAYIHLQSLKTKLSAKNQLFFQYKDDAAFANNHACSGNKRALHRLCTDQVEKLMELWNTNDEFRQDYVKSNTRSTIRRLGTLDGRSLGPGEKPPALPSYPRERVDRVDLVQKIPTTVKNVTPDEKFLKRTQEHENRKVTVLDEVELTKKAEEMLRKEEAEAKLKEQRRLEELAKAEVAREKTKKRQAEKEQKEAEEKEKERLRRLRKKEKKKEKKKADAAVMDVNNDFSISETLAAKLSKDDESTVVPKKPQTSQPTKALPVPPALLRQQNKKSYRQLMWTSLIGLLIYILFWLGNFDVLSKLNVIN